MSQEKRYYIKLELEGESVLVSEGDTFEEVCANAAVFTYGQGEVGGSQLFLRDMNDRLISAYEQKIHSAMGRADDRAEAGYVVRHRVKGDLSRRIDERGE